MKSGLSVFQSAYYVYDRGAQRSTPPKASEGAGSGDGNLMRGTVNGRVTFYPGRQYNKVVEGSSVTVQKFYALGSLTIAVRTVQGTQDTLNWVLGDHLGSTSVTANADGSWNSTLKYTAFGEVRSEEGSTPTEYKYTGQLEQAEIGLYYYVARWYDSELAHFVQADTIVPQPGDASTYDRYAYTLNNPIRFNDPSGNFCQGGDVDDNGNCLLPGYGVRPAKSVLSLNTPSVIRKSVNTDQSSWHLSDNFYWGTSNNSFGTSIQPWTIQPPIIGNSNGIMNIPKESENSGKEIANGINTISIGLDLADSMNWFHIPGYVGVSLDAFSQSIYDNGKNYSILHELTRIIVVSAEGQVISYVSVGVASIPGVAGTATLGPIGGSTMFVVTYLLTTNISSEYVDQKNESAIFPNIGKFFGERW